MMLVDAILTSVPQDGMKATYDINGDNDISVADVMVLADIILNNGSGNGGNGSGSGIGDTSQAYLYCPDDNHPHIIDLGLPSGTKWACCNVEANSPEEYGGEYA